MRQTRSLPTMFLAACAAAALVLPGLADEKGATLTIDGGAATEGYDLTFTVTLDRAVPGGFTVTPTYEDGTATSGADYTANTNALDFAGTANESHTFTVATIDDDVWEVTEEFKAGMTVSGTTHAVSATATATGAIRDGDVEPVVAAASAVVASGDTTTIYSPGHPDFGNRKDYKCDVPNRVVETTNRATRSKVYQIACSALPGAILHGAVVEIWGHEDYEGTATEGSSGDWDYSFYNSKITIYPGERGPQHLGILINDDQTGEGSENIWFKLKWTTKLGYPPAWFDLAYSTTEVQLSIDDDDEYDLSVSPGQVWEEAGDQTVTVTATTKSGATLDDARTLSVQVGAGTDTAVEGTDYQTVSNFDVTVPKGSSRGSATFTLTPIDDTLMEAGERITVAASGGTQINGRTLTPRVNGTDILMTDNETVNLSASPSQVGEGAGATTVTVTAAVEGGGEVSLATPVTVKVGLSGDTATKGTDYATVSDFTITIPVGKSSATGTFTLTPTDDTTIEPTETITLGGVKSEARKYRVGTTTVQLLDNDPDAVTITAVPGTMGEDASPTTVTVRATAATSLPMARTVTVTVGKSGDSATEGTDYATVADFTITIPANDTTAGVDMTLTPTDDTLVENDETITVSGSGTNMTVTGASITLTDDDDAITLSANPPSVVEGRGAKTITVTATGVGAGATARTVTIEVGKSGDSATDGTDYATVADFTITIAANAKTGRGTFKLTPTDDATVEGDEWITVSGTSTGATVTGTGVHLIDNDSRIALSANPASVTELPGIVTQVTVTATVNSTLSSARTVPVQVGKTGDSATEGTDYATVADFSITIPANAASGTGTFPLQTKGDEVFEGAETISVYGSLPAATVIGTTVSIVEGNEFNPFSLTANPATVSEGAGATQVTVTVTVGGRGTVKDATPVKVQIGQAADTATEGTDYATVADFTVTIAAGQASATGTFTLTPTDDSVAEISEDIAVIGSVKDHTNVQGTNLTLTDNDAAVTLSAAPASVTENGGATEVTVTATMTSSLSGTATPVTVSVGESGDSATEGTDYATVAGLTISIPAGEKSATGKFTLTPVDDTLYEGASESLTVDGSAANATVSGTSVAITDNDAGVKTKVDLSISPTRVKECSADTTMTVTAELSDDVYTLPEDRKMTLSVGKTGDSATSGTDYTAVDDFDLTIKAGQHTGTATFTLSPTDDTDEEGDEKLTIEGTATRLEVGNDVEATIEDDDQPIIVLTMSPSNIPEQKTGRTTTVTVTASQWTGIDRCATDAVAEARGFTASSVGASAEQAARAVLGAGARAASASSDQTVAVTIGDTGDTAVSGTDYTAVTGFNVTIKDGETKGTATFTTRGVLDSILEPPETLTVKGALTGKTVTPAKGQVDDKDKTSPTLTVSPTSVAEDASATTVTVTMNTGGVTASESFEVPFKVTSGTATAGTDFAKVNDFNGLLGAGDTSLTATFTLTPTDDTVVEGDETIKVSIPGAKPALEATVTLTEDDETDITLSGSPTTVAEGGTATSVTVTAATDGDTFAADRTVTVSVGDSGTATSGTDYAALADFDITIKAGLSSATADFTLTPTQDTVVEGDETVAVDGTSTGETVNGTDVSITDDDSTDITLRVSPSSVAENAGATTVTVTAVTDGDTFSADRTVTVSVGESTDSAASGTDYTAVADFDVTITAGNTSGSADFTLTPTQDTIIEGDETITVSGSATGLAVNDPGPITLTDDDSTDITLSANLASVSEGASATTVTVTAASDGDTFKTARTVSVTVGKSGDGATSGTDYAAVTGFDVTIPAGGASGSAAFTLTPTADSVAEGDESISLQGTATGLTVIDGSMTLADDDDGAITLTASPDSIAEGASATTVTVTAATNAQTYPADRKVRVTVGASGDGATSGTDYAAVTAFDITIAKGDTSGTGTFSLTPTEDRIIEGDESITVDGTSTGVTVHADTVTLTDDDSTAISITLSDPQDVTPVSVPEGGEATTVTVTAATDGDTFKTDRTVTVSVGASGDSATAGTDYAAVADLDIVISAGDTSGSGTFIFTPKQDTLVEGNETAAVSGTSTGLTVNGTTATIDDDDSVPSVNLSTNPTSVSEGASGTTVTVTAKFSNSSTYTSAKTVAVTVGASGDSTTSGTDYAAVTGFDVTISAGNSSGVATFTLTPTDDTLVEGNESISVDGSSSELSVHDASMTLADDEDVPAVNLSASPSSVAETADATTVTVTAEFSNTNTYAADQTVTVSVGDSGDGAASGTDYAAVADFDLTIAVGKTSGTATFTLTPKDDTLVEGNETFSVSGAATGMTVNGASVTLTDDDGPPAVNISVAPTSVSEGASATEVTVTATFSNTSTYAAAKKVTVTVGDSADTATSGTDYAAVTDFDVTVAAGDSSGTATFTLTPTQDTLVEGNEILSASGTSDLTVNGTSLRLNDDDGAPAINLSASLSSVSEGAAATTVTVTAAFSNASTFGAAKKVTVTVGDSADSAVSGTDYAAVAAFDLTIAAGKVSGTATVTLTPTDDRLIEGNETVSLAGTSDLAVNGTSITLTDDDSTAITLSASPSSVSEADSATEVTITAATDGDKFIADRTVRVKVGSVGDSATSGKDYAAVSAFDITLKANDTNATGTFTLTPTEDNVIEGDEALTVSGTSAGLTVNATSATIEDNEEPKIILDIKPFLSTDPDKLAEGAGATRVTVTAGTTGGVFDLDREIHVTVGQSGDTAVFGMDYDTPLRGFHVEIEAQATQGETTFTLTPTDDVIVEGDESLTLEGSAAGLEVTTATITIKDNDVAGFTLSASPASVSEGAAAAAVSVRAATGGVTFETDRKVTVTVGDADDSAASGTDYAAVADFDIVVSAGESSGAGTFALKPVDDTLIEGDETISLGGVAADGTVEGASVTLSDNEGIPSIRLSAAPASVSEGAGATQVTVTAVFSNASTYTGDRKVTISVGETGTATAGTDHAPVADFGITIAKGETSGTGTFTLIPTQDTLVEGDETIRLAGSATGMSVYGADLTLTDDDNTAIALTATPPSVAENAGATSVAVTAATDGTTFVVDRTVTVAVGAAGDTATSGTDYAAGGDFGVTIAAGETSGTATFTLTPIDDALAEGDERITLSGASAGLAVGNTAATLTDDDAAATGVVLSAAPSSVAEDGGARTVEVTATLAGSSVLLADTRVSVSVGADGDAATEGEDYANVGDFAVTVAAGESSGSATFALTPVEDSLVEGSESITVSGSADGLAVAPAEMELLDSAGAGAESVGLALSVVPSEVAESAGARTVEVTASLTGGGALARDGRVTVSVGGGTATPQADYAAVAELTIDIAARESSGTATFTLAPVNDDVVEGDETVDISGSLPDVGTATAEVLIADDDAAYVTAGDAHATEGDELRFPVALSNPATVPVAVSYSTSDGTATAGADYEAASGIVRFAAGATQASVSVATREDALQELDEHMALDLAVPPEGFPVGVQLGTPPSGTGTIASDDIAVVSLAPAQAEEGDDLNFEASLWAVSGSERVPVAAAEDVALNYRSADGTAVAPTDYAAASGVATIPKGAASTRITVSTMEDSLAEPDERMTLSLSGPLPEWLRLDSPSAPGTILNDDVALVSVAPTEALEGAELAFEVSMSRVSTAPLRVAYATVGGTASAPGDYVAASGVLTIPASAASATVAVASVADDMPEADETMALSLSEPPAGLPAWAALADLAQAPGTILNDDFVVVSVAPAAAAEGAELRFEVSLSVVPTESLDLAYATADGTAIAGADYAHTEGVLTVAAGATSATIVVATHDDAIAEPDETLALALSPTAGFPPWARIGEPSAQGVILNDDVATVSLAGAAAKEGEDLVFGVSLSTPAAAAVELSFATADGTALAGEDYVAAASGRLAIASGSSGATVVVPTLEDDWVEGDESLELVVRAAAEGLPAAVEIGGAALRAPGTVIDIDVGALAIAPASADEGKQIVFEVTVSTPVVTDVSLSWGTADRTARAGEDYVAERGRELAIAAGERRAEIAVDTVADLVVEPDETFEVRIAASGGLPANVEIADPSAVGTIGDDDAATAARLGRIHEPILADLSLAMTESVVDAVSGRIEESHRDGAATRPRGPGAGTASQRGVAPGGEFSRAGGFDPMVSSGPPLLGGPGTWHVGGAFGQAHGRHFPDMQGIRVMGGGGPAAHGFGGRPPGQAPSMREQLGAMSFRYSIDRGDEAEDAEDFEKTITMWGQADLRPLSGSHDDADAGSVAWDGDVLGLIAGADRRLAANLLVGVAASRFDSAFAYMAVENGEQFDGVYATTTTSVHPYLNWTATPRLDVWATAGYGAGGIVFDEPETFGAQAADSVWLTGALGGRYLLAASEDLLPGGATTFDLKADAFASRFDVRDNGEVVEGLSVPARRFRLAVVGEYARETASGASFAPSLELGVRHDGGVGETGTGVEIGARLRHAAAGGRLKIGAHAHMLAAFTGDKDEWGIGGSVRFAPNDKGHGWSLGLRPSYGATGATGGLWNQRGPMRGAAFAPRAPEASVDSEVGYGMGALRGRGLLKLLSGYSWRETGQPRQTAGAALEYGDTAMRLEVERAAAVDGPEHGFLLTFEKGFGAVRSSVGGP